ncbi:MAG: molybdenum cofactor biosynthesis protein MoaE [Acidobacteria bacterium]|nr:MAG: molybdenum cofactor biosynthesis protein MoaE [Acidobacteriota bacterium]
MHDRLVGIGSGPLDLDEVVRQVSGAGAAHGAVVTFIGTVRGENAGRRVLWLEYEAYDELALNAFRSILQEARQHWPTARVAFRHRTGRVGLGEPSVVIAAASPHRAEAFAACRYVIERIKQVAPVWKREFFDGGDSWIEGATARPDDEGAREEAFRRACG